MDLHKKHRVIIALGNNNDVYSIVFPLGGGCDGMAGMMDECKL